MFFGNLYTISFLYISFILYNVVEDVYGDREPRMANGDYATAEEFPSNVFIRAESIQRKRYETVFSTSHCGGSLLTLFHILTAAHCTLSSNQSLSSVYHYLPHEIFVALGVNSVQEIVDQYSVRRIYRHQQYRIPTHANPWGIYDIAILEIHEPINLGPKQHIINLPCYDPEVGDEGIVLGSGLTSSDLASMGKLKKGLFKVVNCQDWVIIGIICVSSTTAQVMKGDSGSGFIINNRIAGIVSLVPPGENYYILTNTFHYFEWILKIIGLPDEFDFLSGVY